MESIYKTAWRMFNKIRNDLMADPTPARQLRGEVEVDETFLGREAPKKLKSKKEAAAFREAKATILGMVERGGQVRPTRHRRAPRRAVKSTP